MAILTLQRAQNFHTILVLNTKTPLSLCFSGVFMFAQRGWQTRQVARDLYHPD
ncbi:hypothetical protein RP300_00822 [Oligella urethralis]|nr:hypothetical protein RP300_00822 [Oligella urethralis]